MLTSSLRTSQRKAVKLASVAVGVMLASASLHADPWRARVRHYVSTHKELFAYDAVVSLGPMADAATTVHCLHASPYCTEGNGVLPPRPSNARVYLFAGAGAAGLVAVGHLVWHFAPHPADRQILIWIAAPVAAGEALQVHDGVVTTEQLQAGK